MKILSDIEIAQSCTPKPITEIARTAGVDAKYLALYGSVKAKVDYALLREVQKPDGKLVLVTAINPTPAGEGKTTTTVGLADGLRKLGQNAMVALREPSMGPVFGVKGGAAGGGWAQVIPMEDINLHFTGDFHAGRHAGQPHPAGQRPGHRPQAHHLEAGCGYERPPAPLHRGRSGRQGQRLSPGGRL